MLHSTMTPFESQVNALVTGLKIPVGWQEDVFFVDCQVVAQDDWRAVARIIAERFVMVCTHD